MKKLLLLAALISLCAPGFCKEKSMAELNPDFENALTQAVKPKNEGSFGYKKETPCFVLFHFSDIHGDALEFRRYAEFLNKYDKYFDGAVCTGDLVTNTCNDDFSYWGKTKGHEKIMLTIGNHDTIIDWENRTGSVWDNQLPMEEVYNRYMKPHIDNWGAVYEAGKTYYYKDFDSKKIRFIAIDCMLRAKIDAAAEKGQLRWFKKTLDSAKEKGYTVVAANHFPVRNSRGLACNFTEGEYRESGWYDEFAAYQAAVDEYMKAGGEFACWLGGHDHCDYLCYNTNYPEQLDICIAATNRRQNEQYSAMMRVEGLKSQDVANCLIVDTSVKTLKIIRLGADSDSRLRQCHGLAIDYKTREIINQY